MDFWLNFQNDALMGIKIWFVFVNEMMMLVYVYLLGIKFIYVLGLMLTELEMEFEGLVWRYQIGILGV
jgi:hypothetical protein